MLNLSNKFVNKSKINSLSQRKERRTKKNGKKCNVTSESDSNTDADNDAGTTELTEDVQGKHGGLDDQYELGLFLTLSDTARG